MCIRDRLATAPAARRTATVSAGVRRADQATVGDKTAPCVAPACCRLLGDGCSVRLDEPQGAIAMHHHPTVIGRGPGIAALWRRCGPRAGQGEPLLAHLRGEKGPQASRDLSLIHISEP